MVSFSCNKETTVDLIKELRPISIRNYLLKLLAKSKAVEGKNKMELCKNLLSDGEDIFQ